MRFLRVLLAALPLFALSACVAHSPAPRPDQSSGQYNAAPSPGSTMLLYPDPPMVSTENPAFSMTLSLSDLTYDLYHALKLSITNRSREKLIIDFNNIWYTIGDHPAGGVIIYDIKRDKRFDLKPAYAIQPGETYTKNVWPERYARYTHRWEHQPLPIGEHGLLALLRRPDGSQLQAQLSLSLKKRYIEGQ